MTKTTEVSPTRDDTLSCNAEESDSRILLHLSNSTGKNKLVLPAVMQKLFILTGCDFTSFLQALEKQCFPAIIVNSQLQG